MIPSSALDSSAWDGLSSEVKAQFREAMRIVSSDGSLPFRVVIVEDDSVTEEDA